MYHVCIDLLNLILSNFQNFLRGEISICDVFKFRNISGFCHGNYPIPTRHVNNKYPERNKD